MKYNIKIRNSILSICACALLTGCNDKTIVSNKQVVYTIDKFIENPAKNSDRINLVDVKNIRTLEDVLHAKYAHQKLKEDGHKAHVLGDRSVTIHEKVGGMGGHSMPRLVKIDTLKIAGVEKRTETNSLGPTKHYHDYEAVYMDADGADKDKNDPLKLYLDKEATFTGMYAHNVDLLLQKNLQCAAFNLDHGKLEIQNDAALKYNSLRVGSGATIVGGEKLLFSTETPGVASINTLKTDRERHYSWVKTGGILLEGSIDNLTLTNEVSLDPRNGASVGTLTHNGGALILSNEHPLTATTYTVSGPSKAEVYWGSTSNGSGVCLTADNINFNSTVQIKLSELDSGVAVGSTLQLMKANLEFNGVEPSKITKSTEGVGVQYSIAINQTTKTVNLRLDNRDDQSALLSGNIAQTLGSQILNNASSQSARRLSVMPLETANKALTPIGEGAYLSHPTIRTVGLSEWLYKAQGMNSIHPTVEDTQVGLLMPLGGDLRVGCGIHWEHQDKKSSTQYAGLMLWGNNFLEAEVNSRANAYKYRAGHIFSNGISLDMQGVTMARSGQMQSDLGMVRVDSAQEFKGSIGLGINRENKIGQLQANVRHELIGYRAKHILKLNDEMYTIPGQSVSSGWSAQIKSTLLPIQGVAVSAVVGFGRNAHTSLNLNCSLEL